MPHHPSNDDVIFRDAFETAAIKPEAFNHEAHLRVAYTYLAESEPDVAFERFRAALDNFLTCYGIDQSRYHETLTKAWILAVSHFMTSTPATSSFQSLIEANRILLDPKIMLSHYSQDILNSKEARHGFVEPNREPIPRH